MANVSVVLMDESHPLVALGIVTTSGHLMENHRRQNAHVPDTSAKIPFSRDGGRQLQDLSTFYAQQVFCIVSCRQSHQNAGASIAHLSPQLALINISSVGLIGINGRNTLRHVSSASG